MRAGGEVCVYINGAGFNIDGDCVAVADMGNRAAVGRFGRNMADNETIRRARETAVCNERNMIGEVLSDKRRRYAEHFAHAGTARRAFIADDNNVAFFNAVILHDLETSFFALENTRCAFKEERAVACEFYDAAFGGEVAVKNAVTAARFYGVVKRRTTS